MPLVPTHAASARWTWLTLEFAVERDAEDASGSGVGQTDGERAREGPMSHVAVHQIQREICARRTQNASVLGKRVMHGLLDVLLKTSPCRLKIAGIIMNLLGTSSVHAGLCVRHKS